MHLTFKLEGETHTSDLQNFVAWEAHSRARLTELTQRDAAASAEQMPNARERLHRPRHHPLLRVPQADDRDISLYLTFHVSRQGSGWDETFNTVPFKTGRDM